MRRERDAIQFPNVEKKEIKGENIPMKTNITTNNCKKLYKQSN